MDFFENDIIKKTKRNKKETVCSVKRHKYDGCGICGSLNTVEQGVIYCEMCGKEVTIINSRVNHFIKDKMIDCKCIKERKIGNKIHKFRPIYSYTILKCTDCGAVKGNFCPNCSKNNQIHNFYKRNCWKYWDGKLYCQVCSYRNC
jgi:hypothetical protein